MYPSGIIKITSLMDKINDWVIPVGIMLCKIKDDIRIKIKNTKVNMNSLDPNSSVFSHEAPMDWKTLLFSNIIWATNNENLADKYIPGRISIKYPKADAIVTTI